MQNIDNYESCKDFVTFLLNNTEPSVFVRSMKDKLKGGAIEQETLIKFYFINVRMSNWQNALFILSYIDAEKYDSLEIPLYNHGDEDVCKIWDTILDYKNVQTIDATTLKIIEKQVSSFSNEKYNKLHLIIETELLRCNMKEFK